MMRLANCSPISCQGRFEISRVWLLGTYTWTQSSSSPYPSFVTFPLLQTYPTVVHWAQNEAGSHRSARQRPRRVRAYIFRRGACCWARTGGRRQRPTRPPQLHAASLFMPPRTCMSYLPRCSVPSPFLNLPFALPCPLHCLRCFLRPKKELTWRINLLSPMSYGSG